jgi:vacuolar-type H+-ATPase subunit H
MSDTPATEPTAEPAVAPNEESAQSTIGSPSRDKNGNIVERGARVVGRTFEDLVSELKSQIETVFHREGKDVTASADEIRTRAEAEAHALLGHEGATLPTEPIVKTTETTVKEDVTSGESEAKKVEDDAEKVAETAVKDAAETAVKDA